MDFILHLGVYNMTIENYGLVEHFDYMCKYIPQPFLIPSESVKSFTIDDNGDEHEYYINTDTNKYSLTKQSLKKLVDSLGIKVRLLDRVCTETDVIDLAVPIINKLLKCFSDCFVFYATADDTITIIDLNVNTEKGEEGTKYELGPSPWKFNIKEDPTVFTCFVDFMNKHEINNTDSSILVKADEILQRGNVNVQLFKNVVGANLQPMLIFNSKFSNMDGFTDIHPALFDEASGVNIAFPMNYAKNEDTSFSTMWDKVIHLYESTDLNDYIFREVNELAASNETPGSVQTFIASILVDSTINLNQPIKDILEEAVNVTAQMKPSKKKSFLQKLGLLIAYSLCMKHSGCSSCGHLDIH